eukprot:4223219-Prymnesium_polylepis.1
MLASRTDSRHSGRATMESVPLQRPRGLVCLFSRQTAGGSDLRCSLDIIAPPLAGHQSDAGAGGPGRGSPTPATRSRSGGHDSDPSRSRRRLSTGKGA